LVASSCFFIRRTSPPLNVPVPENGQFINEDFYHPFWGWLDPDNRWGGDAWDHSLGKTGRSICDEIQQTIEFPAKPFEMALAALWPRAFAWCKTELL
jgi:hypothetical protein